MSRVAYIGDDLPDLDAIKAAGLGACPADAVREILAASDWVSAHAGGTGCVRDLCDYLLDCTAS
jgi:3-deoxy-D-manno-octulosonate 8-phosphate phosphatase (KDO 8-P phosphatase)